MPGTQKDSEEETWGQYLSGKFSNWLVTKGWGYLLVFFLGFSLGGLVFK